MAPRVSVVIPAFNLARYLPAAIDSALAQDPPGGSVEVIVVDDGSTDETPHILEGYADRVRVIRQPNGGLVAAVNRGLTAVNGEYIALLDADDEWPRDRLLRSVAVLEARPTVGLVHGDMEVIDANGHTLQPSFFDLQNVTDGRVLGRLLAANFISGGASTFRSSLLSAIHPIAPDAAYPDWWLAACIAAVAEITHDDGLSNRYRYHGDNMGLGAGPNRQAAIHRRELPWRRWMMWNLADDDTVTVDDVRAALAAWRFSLITAASDQSGRAKEILDVDARSAGELLETAGVSTDGTPLSKALLRAFSRNPFDGTIGLELDVALLGDANLPWPSPAPPLIALETRSVLTIGWLDELLARPELLLAFAEEARAESDATLAVLARRDADLTRLIALVEADERLTDERCDITVLAEPLTTPARALLAARASSLLTLAPTANPYSSLPAHEAVERARWVSREAA